MRIKVKAFASFREMLGSELELDLPDGSSAEALVTALAASNLRFSSEAFDTSGQLKDYVLLMRNRRRMDHDSLKETLSEGDEIAIFPPVSGG
jgi:molybdopterin synthase sulfur carrier subunit